MMVVDQPQPSLHQPSRRIPITGDGRSIAISSDARYLAYENDEQSIVFVDLSTGDRLCNDVYTGNRSSMSMAFSPHNDILAVSRHHDFVLKDDIFIHDVETAREVSKIETAHNDRIQHLAFSLDGTLLASMCKRFIYLWRIETVKLKHVR